MSAARPKIADYPFTTLYPNLGVDLRAATSAASSWPTFPGLIEGAADGAGLGIRFLKHLQRTRVLLHLVDIAPADPAADPVRDAKSIVGELGKFSEDLLAKPRWLVLNKSDLLPPEEAAAKAMSIAQALKYRGPAFLISGATHAGTTRSHRGGDAFPRDRRKRRRRATCRCRRCAKPCSEAAKKKAARRRKPSAEEAGEEQAPKKKAQGAPEEAAPKKQGAAARRNSDRRNKKPGVRPGFSCSAHLVRRPKS